MSKPSNGAASDTRSRTTAVGDATRKRIMQTAERLIAEKGPDGVSVRDITTAADSNSAAIHYHFQSKEGLIFAILEDRAQKLRERRVAYLDALDPNSLSVRDIAEAMVNPTFDFVSDHSDDGDNAYVGFLAALLDDPSAVPAIQEHFTDQYDGYIEALHHARPDLSRATLVNRVCFALHLVLNAVSEPARGLRAWIERHYAPAVETLRQDLIDFISGAFGAP